MTHMKRSIHDRLVEVERAGFTIAAVRQDGKHVRIGAVTPAGRAVTMTVAKTPSDWRAQKNFVALLRRLARAEAPNGG
jgi:hypothetical protein